MGIELRDGAQRRPATESVGSRPGGHRRMIVGVMVRAVRTRGFRQGVRASRRTPKIERRTRFLPESAANGWGGPYNRVIQVLPLRSSSPWLVAARPSNPTPPTIVALCSMSSADSDAYRAKRSSALVNLVGEILRRREDEFDMRNQGPGARHHRRCREGSRRPLSRHEAAVGRWDRPPGPLAVTDISFVGPTTLEGCTHLAVLDELRHNTGPHVYYSVDCVAGALGESRASSDESPPRVRDASGGRPFAALFGHPARSAETPP